MSQQFIAHADREERGYVMAKFLGFVTEPGQSAWPLHFFETASTATGFQFILGANDDGTAPDPPPGMVNHGIMPQPVFLDTLSRSRVLVGVGSPLMCVASSLQHRHLFDQLVRFSWQITDTLRRSMFRHPIHQPNNGCECHIF
jgi:hypothetical protein